MCFKCCGGGGRCLVSWRAWIRPLIVVLYSIVLLVVLPFLVIGLQKANAAPQAQAWFIGGLFVLLTLPISFWEILQHLVHYTKPELQKHIIRILWMVPIYAVNAWFGMLLPNITIYMDTCRECYEAYVIYNFLIFLLNFLKEQVDVDTAFQDRPPAKQLCPFCCFPPCQMGPPLIEKCKHGILQYTVVRPITTVVAFICAMCGVYGEGQFDSDVAFPYLAVINNVSQFIAMYCLVFFYRAHKKELEPMNPLSKFLCIKAVVFFSFFQGFIISILVYTGVISETFTSLDDKEVKRMASSLQDFLICIEMLLAAVAHMYAFSYKPYVSDDDSQVSCWKSFKEMLDVSDVRQDVSDHIRAVGSTVGRSVGLRRAASYPTDDRDDDDDAPDERTRLLQPTRSEGHLQYRVPQSLQNCTQTTTGDETYSSTNRSTTEGNNTVNRDRVTDGRGETTMGGNNIMVHSNHDRSSSNIII